MGAFAVLLTVGILAVTGAGGTAAYLYLSDCEAEATVQADCAGGSVPIRTKLFGIDHTVTGIPAQQCLLIQEGNFVEHRVRSKHTTLYEGEGGDCIYDTVDGPGCGRLGGGVL